MKGVLPSSRLLAPEAYRPDDDLAFLAWELAFQAHSAQELTSGAAFDIVALLKSYFKHIDANFPGDEHRDFASRPDYFEELNESLAAGMAEITKDNTYTS